MNISAPAKINLGLEVLHRRPDGFHEVNTVYAALNFCDELELSRRDDGEFLCLVEGNRQLEKEPAEENLCVRAATALRQAIGGREGVTIRLKKHIPTGAGLGGGSSDAAATLLGCAQLWNASISAEELNGIAAQLGSDVPFFLGHTVAQATSRGEVLAPLHLSLPWNVLLVNPGLHVPTPWAYRAINRIESRPASDLVGTLRFGVDQPELLRELMVNDFEDAVFSEHSVLREIKEELYNQGAVFALMSGSGSTMFGLFEDRERARAAGKMFDQYWNRVVGFRN